MLGAEDTLTIQPLSVYRVPRWWRERLFALIACSIVVLVIAPPGITMALSFAAAALLFASIPAMLWMARRPISVDATSIRQAGVRVLLDGASIDLWAWTASGGHVGTMLVIARGRSRMRIATHGVLLEAPQSSPEADLQIGNVEFARLLARIAPQHATAIGRPPTDARACLWASPARRFPKWLEALGFTVVAAAVILAARVASPRVPVAALALVLVAFQIQRRGASMRQRALRVADRTVTLETDGHVTWQTTSENPPRLVVLAVGRSVIALQPQASARAVVVASDAAAKADLCLSPEDFRWLAIALGLTTA